MKNVGWDYNHVKARLGFKDPLPIWRAQMASKLVLVVGRRLQFLPMLASLQGCLTVLKIWLLSFLTMHYLREYKMVI